MGFQQLRIITFDDKDDGIGFIVCIFLQLRLMRISILPYFWFGIQSWNTYTSRIHSLSLALHPFLLPVLFSLWTPRRFLNCVMILFIFSLFSSSFFFSFLMYLFLKYYDAIFGEKFAFFSLTHIRNVMSEVLYSKLKVIRLFSYSFCFA